MEHGTNGGRMKHMVIVQVPTAMLQESHCWTLVLKPRWSLKSFSWQIIWDCSSSDLRSTLQAYLLLQARDWIWFYHCNGEMSQGERYPRKINQWEGHRLTRINLTDITMSKGGQTQKRKYCMIQFMKFKNSKTNVAIKVRIAVISGSRLVRVLDTTKEKSEDIFLWCVLGRGDLSVSNI